MTARRHTLHSVLNRVLRLDLVDFTEARVFLRSPEGSDLLDAWLASAGAADKAEETA